MFNPEIQNLVLQEKESKLKYKNQKEIFENIFMGGMPDICTKVSEREAYFKAYVSTYIEKDIKK